MNARRILSIPGVLVAVLALLLGTMGLAAAGNPTAKKLTKATVTKIVKRVVAQKAPTLSVDNANRLAGLPASAYLDRVAFTSQVTGVAMVANVTTQILGPLNLTVPSGAGFVHVTATNSYFGGNASASLWFAQDVLCTDGGVGSTNRVFTSSQPTQTAATVNFVLAVTPGVHTYRLCGVTSPASGAYSSTLSVETVQVGASGTSSIARQGGPAGDRDLRATTPQ